MYQLGYFQAWLVAGIGCSSFSKAVLSRDRSIRDMSRSKSRMAEDPVLRIIDKDALADIKIPDFCCRLSADGVLCHGTSDPGHMEAAG